MRGFRFIETGNSGARAAHMLHIRGGNSTNYQDTARAAHMLHIRRVRRTCYTYAAHMLHIREGVTRVYSTNYHIRICKKYDFFGHFGNLF